MDLIRELLLRFEKNDSSIPEGYTELEVAYHVNQMVKSGLIDAHVIHAPSPGKHRPVKFIFKDIEPAGHEFISGLRDGGFWAKVKREASNRAAPLTLDLLLLVAKEVGRKAFFLSDSPESPTHSLSVS